MNKTERLMLSVAAALLTLDATACTPKRDDGLSGATPTPTPLYGRSGSGSHGGGSYGGGSYGGTRYRRTSTNGVGTVTSSSSSGGNFFSRIFGSIGHAFSGG